MTNYRMTNDELNPNDKTRRHGAFKRSIRHSDFDIRSSFGIRASSF
jgi:hypothetical protein